MKRRHFLTSGSVLMAAGFSGARENGVDAVKVLDGEGMKARGFSVRWEMIGEPDLTVRDKFQLLKDLGYDGVELDSQFLIPAAEVVAARDAVGLPVHGVVNANHWSLRLSDPVADLRARAVEEVRAGLRYAQEVGAETLEVLPGAVRNALDENEAQVEERSLAAFRDVLALAESCGVKLAVCNAANGFLVPEGSGAMEDRPAVRFLEFIEKVPSRWLGVSLHPGALVHEMAVTRWVSQMGPRLLHFCLGEESGETWRASAGMLVKSGYNGWVGSAGRGGDRAWLAEHLRKMQEAFKGWKVR